MTHDELLATLAYTPHTDPNGAKMYAALRAIVELHTPSPIPDWVPSKEELMCWCAHVYPCPTIQVIEKELQ
jgi:hypothetical protein